MKETGLLRDTECKEKKSRFWLHRPKGALYGKVLWPSYGKPGVLVTISLFHFSEFALVTLAGEPCDGSTLAKRMSNRTLALEIGSTFVTENATINLDLDIYGFDVRTREMKVKSNIDLSAMLGRTEFRVRLVLCVNLQLGTCTTASGKLGSLPEKFSGQWLSRKQQAIVSLRRLPGP